MTIVEERPTTEVRPAPVEPATVEEFEPTPPSEPPRVRGRRWALWVLSAAGILFAAMIAVLVLNDGQTETATQPMFDQIEADWIASLQRPARATTPPMFDQIEADWIASLQRPARATTPPMFDQIEADWIASH